MNNNNDNYHKINEICSEKYKNVESANKPYRVRNNLLQEAEALNQNDTPPTNEEVPETKPESSIGYLTVGVFTALGALPVPDAVVTIYNINDEGEEIALYHLITDANGRVPTVPLPSVYDPTNPLTSPEIYFSYYNMRVQAINYYTVNVLDIRIFPDITTSYRVDLIPVMSGAPDDQREQTIVIPPSPIDKSNE